MTVKVNMRTSNRGHQMTDACVLHAFHQSETLKVKDLELAGVMSRTKSKRANVPIRKSIPNRNKLMRAGKFGQMVPCGDKKDFVESTNVMLAHFFASSP